jgi:hypothetical protein
MAGLVELRGASAGAIFYVMDSTGEASTMLAFLQGNDPQSLAPHGSFCDGEGH